MATTELTFSPEELRAKYRAEREKRLREDGTAQYRDFSGVYADFDKDPYADPDFKRDPIVEETDVTIIGGGFGGMMAAARLTQQGIRKIRIIDKAGDFGGTWYWNRYPGAACDVESYIYLPFLEETGYVPVEKYSKATEIFEHAQRIGRHFELYPMAMFQTHATDVSWSDAKQRWTIITDRQDVLTSRFVLIAGGVLHKAKLPGIPGIENFKGHSFHTSRWDYAYAGGSPTSPMVKLNDKTVAIIGTGATSVQAVPKLGEAAKLLYVVQRTPSGVGVRANAPTDFEWAKSLKPGWQQERMDNFTAVVSGMAFDRDMVGDGWTEIFRGNAVRGGQDKHTMSPEEQQIADFQTMEGIRGRIDSIVKDRETAEALKPWYYQMCKRPCFHDEYLDAFNRPNVKLLDTAGEGVERITEKGLVIKGVEYPVDCIIYASGFESSTSYMRRLGFEIHGRNGISLSEAWANGPGTLHGMFARRFPNLVMFSATQGGWAINFVHALNELAVHAAYVIKQCLDGGIEAIEPSEEVQEAWWQVVAGTLMKTAMFQSECTPSYLNAEGSRDPRMAKNAAFMGGTMEYVQYLRDWRASGDLPGLELTRVSESTEA